MKQLVVVSLIYTISFLSISCTNQSTSEKLNNQEEVKNDTADPWERLTRDAVLAIKDRNPEKAKEYCSSALELVNNPETEGLRTVKTHMLFGEIYRWEGKYKESEESFKKAVDICERVIGLDHPDMIIPLESLANLYYYTLVDLEKVAELYARILTLVEANTPPNDFQVAVISSNLAQVYQKLKQYEKAEFYYTKALDVSKGNEENIAQYLYLCSGLYKEWGKCEQAEVSALKLVKIRENNKKNHIDAQLNFANALDMLGRIYLSCNEPEKAGELYKRSLNIIEEVMENEEEKIHPDMVIHLTGLGESLYQQEKYGKANSYYKKALDLAQKFMGPESIEVANILEKYAASLQKSGNEIEAQERIRNAQEIKEKMCTIE